MSMVLKILLKMIFLEEYTDKYINQCNIIINSEKQNGYIT